MLIDERRRRIVDILNSELSISTKELSQRLNVSEMTIWRDLKQPTAAAASAVFSPDGSRIIISSGDDTAR